jgi:hypothetical protein
MERRPPKWRVRGGAARLPLKNIQKSSLIFFPSTRGAKMSERPQYRALGRIVLPATGVDGSRTIEADENFFYDGVPNNAFRPLNALARAAKLKSIDRHWRETPHRQIGRLAKSLGYHGADSAAAQAFIDEFIRETEKETSP